jgi:predicted DNA-binding transcriptional regulator AlpA
MDGHSTRQAAQKLGLSLPTLNKYIALKLIPTPQVTKVGGVRVRLWSDSDIEKVREILPKIANGRKTRHKKQKKQTKKKSNR